MHTPALLTPIISIENSSDGTSWVGGNPCLPDNVDWPELDGSPAIFRAQIDCRALPPGIWDNRGPKSGWLCFFSSAENLGNVKILHNQDMGQPRLSNAPIDDRWLIGGSGERWWSALQPPNRQLPRWPLRIEQREAQWMGPKYKAEPNLRMDFVTKDANLADPDYLPFDQLSAHALVDAAGVTLEDSIRYLVKHIQYLTTLRDEFEKKPPKEELPETEPPEEQVPEEELPENRLATAEERLATLAEQLILQRQLATLLNDRVTTSEIDATTLGEIRAFSDTLSFAAHDEKYARVLRDLTVGYASRLETYARTLYTHNPDALPNALREKLTRVWEFDAAYESASMGGPISEGFSYDAYLGAVQLLLLPTSDLLGCAFGDLGEWSVFIPPEALADQDWSKAWGSVSN